MIIETNKYNPAIFYKEPDVYNSGVLTYSSMSHEVAAINITPKMIPDNISVKIDSYGEDNGSGPFGQGCILKIELNNNIYLSFDNKDIAMSYYKMLVKIGGNDIQSVQDVYPEFFI